MIFGQSSTVTRERSDRSNEKEALERGKSFPHHHPAPQKTPKGGVPVQGETSQEGLSGQGWRTDTESSVC